MKLKLMDTVFYPILSINGQVTRIRQDVVTIQFVTGERFKERLNKIIYVNNQWRIND